MRWSDVRSRILPQFFPVEWTEDPGGIFCQPFPSRVRIGFVVKSRNASSYLTLTDFVDLGVSESELQQTAYDNLGALSTGRIKIARVPEGAEGYISADDNFAAVRILLPSARQIISEALGPNFLMTIPHRDDCFFWSESQTAARQGKHQENAAEDFLKSPNSLTPDVIAIRGHEFSLREAQPSIKKARRPDLTLLDGGRD